MDYQELRRDTLTQICLARKHYFRLQRDLAELTNTLPDKCYLAKYKSNSSQNPQLPDNEKPGFWYYALGCADKALPCARSKDPKNRNLTKKLHLGHVENPNYLTAVLELERSHIKQAKEKSLAGVREHLKNLQSFWLAYKRQGSGGAVTISKEVAGIFRKNIYSETIFEFIYKKSPPTL